MMSGCDIDEGALLQCRFGYLAIMNSRFDAYLSAIIHGNAALTSLQAICIYTRQVYISSSVCIRADVLLPQTAPDEFYHSHW